MTKKIIKQMDKFGLIEERIHKFNYLNIFVSMNIFAFYPLLKEEIIQH